MKNPWKAALADLAMANEGLLMTRDMKQLGLTDDQLRAVRPQLHRICQGAYTLDPPATEAQRHLFHVRAAVRRHEHDVAASHFSAVVAHDLPVWGVPLDEVHVTGLSGEVREGARHRVHTHHGPLADSDLDALAGLAVTTPGRTVMDCARRLPLAPAVVIADAALHLGLATRTDLERRLAALPAMEGIATARRLVDLVDEKSESPGETRTRLVFHEARIPVDSQVDIFDDRGGFLARSDFRVRGTNVLTEFDGRGKYSLSGDVEEAHWREKLRQHNLEAAGFVVVRVTWADLSNPRPLVARVHAAMARDRRLNG